MTEKLPSYSVLMSVYFKEKKDWLIQSIESMLNQTVLTDDFVLVKDGKLTDELNETISEYCEKYPDIFHIIELENGQPMIFEQSARQIKSYLIANGRGFSKGFVFKYFKKDFNVYSVNSPLVSYYSVDNSFVLTQVTQNNFQEVLCLKTSCATLVFNNKLYVFYLDNSLMGVCSDNLTEKHCIVENISGSNHISAFVHNNCIFVTTDNTLYEIDLNFNVVCKQEINLSLNNMTNNNTTNNYKAYNASYNSNSYKELVYNYNILKRDVEKLNNKYNELSNYVGSMQEQIRRLRLN